MILWWLLAAATVLATAAGCPAGCTCKWKGGKQTVECVNKSMSAIPVGMDAGTQVLDMSGNALAALSRGRFIAAGLSNLQKIFMARCRITYVDDAAFQGLSNLVELDLSDNGVAEIPTKSFDDYPQLMKLVLSGNAVTAVRTAAFKRLAYLTVLDLSRCRLSVVEPGAFDGLQSLEWLRLDHNRIVRIEGAGGSAPPLPMSLHGIEMHHNPWTCDCRLRDVHRWLNENGAPHTVEPTCREPDRLRDSVIRKLDAEELACAPEAAAASPTYVETDAGKNVTLACRMTPAGEARVSWWFEGQPLANGTARGTELSIEDAGPADNGTYACVAENRAGRAACNFTVRVVQEPSEMAAGSYPPDAPTPAVLTVVLIVGSVLFVTVAVLCAVSCRLVLSKRRGRRRADGGRHHRDGKSNGAAHDDSDGGGLQQAAKTPSDIRQSDSANLTASSTLDGKLSSADDVSAAYGEYDAAAGSGTEYEIHDVLHAVGGYDAYRAHATACHTATATAATTTTTTATTCNTITVEANPDLISDASAVVRDDGGDCHDANAGGDLYCKIAVPPVRDFWPVGTALVYPSGGGGSYELQLSPGKLMAAAGEPYPADYGLPKLLQSSAVIGDGYPADYGLPKLFTAPYPPASLYQTLPNRRNAAKPQGRSCQEAEFVMLQQQQLHNRHHHHHHHHHHHRVQPPPPPPPPPPPQQQHNARYEPQNVRYNQQGYPYPADAASYYAAATYHDPPSLTSNASAQTLDDETMMMMMIAQPVAANAATALPVVVQSRQQKVPVTAEQQQQQHKAVTSVQKQSAAQNTESPDEGYVGEGPDS